MTTLDKLTNVPYPQHLRTALEHMLNDQGLETAEAESVELPEGDDGKPIDWLRVDRFLGTLSDEDLETLCIGDADDMPAIAARGGEDGAYAHAALDTLFEVLGG